MNITLKSYIEKYLDDIYEIWNEAIDERNSLLWTEHFPKGKIEYILSTQIECICALIENRCVGFYILHPNTKEENCNVANALYIVKKEFRNKGIGTALVKHSLDKAKNHGFSAMQYNSVVESNKSVNIYFKLGFKKINDVKNGFNANQGHLENLLVLYKEL